jgi:hypothetical protein
MEGAARGRSRATVGRFWE